MTAASDTANRPSRLAVATIRLETLWLLLLIVGTYGAGFKWRTGAFLALAAVCGRVSGHLLVGWTEYRRIMSHPWPQVAALAEDEDW